MLRLRFLFLVLFSFAFSSAISAQQSDSVNTVTVITIKGAIGPTVTSYIERGLNHAQDEAHEALIVELDTPGGLLTSTQEIVQLMLASELPIAVYVSPEGANAGSAGTFITLAAHVAAMSPTTTIGAASPVSMQGGQMDSVMQKKIFSYSENFIQNIAEKRGRNADWAISAVHDGEALTEKEALELNVIDIIATDLNDLLLQMDGLEFEGEALQTQNAAIKRLDKSLAEKFFSFILLPEIMLILTLIAIYGIVGEVTNPGAIIPGVAGVIALILLLYGVASMPINIAGFILIGFAIALFVAEAFTPSFGILITGGAISFFLGALMLFQDLPENMQISWYWLVPATLLTVLFFSVIATAGIRAQFSPHRSGLESHIGKRAKVVDSINHESGRIDFAGEYWNARSESKIKEGDWCEIVGFKGLTCYVKPLTKDI